MTDIPTPDDAVHEVPTPDEPVPDHAPVPDPPSDPAPEHHEPSHERPAFADEILDRIDNLVEVIKGDPPPEVAPVVEPDETPVKRPWTHRNPFKRS